MTPLHLEELYSLKILDTENEEVFQNIVNMAALICKTSDSAITLIDKNRQWTKAGTANAIKNIPVENSFCIHTIASRQNIYIVDQPETNELFSNNPLVKKHHLRFYAGVPIKSPAGTTIGSLCVFHLQHHQLSEEQVNALQLLGKQVDLLLEQRAAFQQAQEEVRELQSKEGINKLMLSMLAHEIKTPLSNIQQLLGLFQQGALSREELTHLVDDSQERVDLLICTVEKLMYLGTQLLHSSSRRMKFYNIEELVRETVALQAKDIEAKQNLVSISCYIDTDVYVDGIGLQLVLNNLLHNANKYTTSGNINIWIFKEKDTLLIKVADDGKGMDKKTVHTILNDSPIASSLGTKNEKGSGAGLFLTRQYLKHTGGDMFISSLPNMGTTVTLQITEVQFIQEMNKAV
ncbi:GAF domain-containing sensor histidine kinase [Aridibaculum aurantiacum]|uniref:GAF domain-containing sensor histidine kinase n=1 Tax=Aridibaculum aurantiacum TaxID=2810307 RepID=UPI001A95E0BD|nr:GAF domain-containing sensor histidine kinase [Aridibaculum aurantiacum]